MIGNILLTLAFAAGVFSVIMYFLTYKGYKKYIAYGAYRLPCHGYNGNGCERFTASCNFNTPV
jgi:hypothetical protein